MITTQFNAFGWVIDRYVFAQGEQYTIELRKDTPKESLANRTFYVKGNATGVSDNPLYDPPERNAGFFYTDMPDVILAATTVYTANTPLEWWCLNWHMNNKSFPVVSRLIVEANTSASVPDDKKLFLCLGKVQVADVEYTGPCEAPSGNITAIEDAYGLLFD